MFIDDMQDPETGKLKFKYRFWDFVFRWWGIFGMLACVVASLAVFFALYAFLGLEYRAIIFWASVLTAIASIILTTVIFFRYRKWRYGVGWGEGGEEKETADKYETYNQKPTKNLAKHQPDTLSDQEIDKKLAKINKKRKKK